jgi:hypothetical protein
MAEPDWNPDTGGRSLAEILREAGIERATRANRRRGWDDPDEAGLRQRRAEAAADRSNSAGYGRRKSDLADEQEEAPARDRRALQEPRESRKAREPREARELQESREPRDPRDVRRAAAEPSTAAIPGLRPDRKPGVPHASGPIPGTPLRERRATEQVPPARERAAARSTATRTPVVEEHPSTGPIPVVRPDDIDDADLESTPKESALAWLRFAGELVIALAAGVGVYFAATLLWEQLPHLAVFLAPLAVAGLVAGVGMWRQRQGREPIGPRLLALLVFAGTLLTIAPAAGLLATAGT